MKEILKNIHILPLGGVNAYLIDHGKITLIDTGYAGNGQKIINYLGKIGKTPKDLENIIITHLHTDHAGSLAELKKMTGAKTFAHVNDAILIEQGISFRDSLEISPGFINKLVFRFFVKNAPRTINPVKIDHKIEKGDDVLPIANGLKIVHVPGHASGQIALLYPNHGGVLFAADTCGNLGRLGVAPFYENYSQGKKDIFKLSKLQFNSILFGHGKPILKNASYKFKKKFNKILSYYNAPVVGEPIN